MNFTIFNYSSTDKFQPLYLHESLTKTDGCNSYVFGDTSKIYEIYDNNKPDYSIVSALRTNYEHLMHYNKNTDNKIKHILNLDGVPEEHVGPLRTFLKNEKELQVVLTFSTDDKFKSADLPCPFVKIISCADIYLPTSQKYFDISKLIIVSVESDKKEYDGDYHTFNLFNENDVADIKGNNMFFTKICNNYSEIIFRNIDADNIPEAFFTSLSLGVLTYFDNDDEEKARKLQSTLQNIFDKDTKFDYNNKGDYNIDAIKETIKKKHTPVNRVKTILSQLKDTYDIIQNMEQK